MKANTAIAFILSGLSLLLLTGSDISQQELLRIAPSHIRSGINRPPYALRISFGWSFGIDQLFVQRLGFRPVSSRENGFYDSSKLFRHWPCANNFKRPDEVLGCAILTLSAAFISLIALTTYLYRGKITLCCQPYSTMALHTTITFVVLSFGLHFFAA